MDLGWRRAQLAVWSVTHWAGVAVALAATTLPAGCTSYVKRGSALYGEQRYVEAAEVFERTEGLVTDATPRERAEYGLYRGLTLYVLGDMRGAERWLAYAYQVESARPGSLRPSRRTLLDRGWQQLHQPAMVPGPAEPTVAASAPFPPGMPPSTPVPGGPPSPPAKTLLPQ